MSQPPTLTALLESFRVVITDNSKTKSGINAKLSAVKTLVDAAEPYSALVSAINGAVDTPTDTERKKILEAFTAYRKQLDSAIPSEMFEALKRAARPNLILTMLMPIMAVVFLLVQITLLVWKGSDSSTEWILVLFVLIAILHLVFVHWLFRVSMPLAQVRRYGSRNDEEQKLVDRCSGAEQYKPTMQWLLNISMVLTVVAVIPKATVYKAYLSGKAPTADPVVSTWAGQIEHIITLDSLQLATTRDAVLAGKKDSLLAAILDTEVRKALQGRQSEPKAIIMVGGARADTATAWGADLLFSTNNTYRVGRAMLQGPLGKDGLHPRMLVVHAGDPFHATSGLRAPTGAVAIYAQWP